MDTTFPSRISINVDAAVFETALTLTGKERELFLDRVYGTDPAGRARVKRLVEQSGESSAFFHEVRDHGAVLASEVLEHAPQKTDEVQAPEGGLEAVGSCMGPYLLLSRIGHGGWGVVYEAEQQEPVRRRVALKIIRLGMDTEIVIKLFEAERQALALMDHPNIAHVYDAGATDDGRPYFVMELVSGERITAYCDRLRLDPVARIHLFLQVCQGIQYAHQKGVIHRDIKPSNVLVSVESGEPMPKVIDFGVAKATTPGGQPGQAAWSSIDQVVGTPPYMSPEQVDRNGMDVDTRSDIYSLGALLYELIAGRAPFDGEKLAVAGMSEMRRILLETKPPRLSQLFADLPVGELKTVAAVRHSDPARLISRVRGDLDHIVEKAMAKNRDDRYQTVNALAADLRRFLNKEPIAAHPPSRLYVLKKFVARNRVACVSAVAVGISITVGLGVSTWLYIEERKAFAAQERFGREAEAARAQEAWLREQAQARANVSQAAVLLSEGKIEEADALLRQSPLESIEPSREAAGVYRVLGNWYAAYRRWPQAVQCYVLLDQANRLDDPKWTVEETDLLVIAPVLLKSGNRPAYEKFREETLERHFPAKNALQAEHLLKVCLLAPTPRVMLDQMKGTADMCISGVGGAFPEWEAFALALYFYRLGNYDQCLKWAERCLSFPDPPFVRTVGILALTAASRFQMGDRTAALKDYVRAKELFDQEMEKGLPDRGGSWHSWLVDELLLNEAGQVVGVAQGG